MSAPEPACSLHSARRLGWLALLALAVGLGLWLWLAPISSAVIVHGTVEPEGRQQGVQHALGGTVRRIHLREGDHVAAGQLMIELDGRLLVAELASIDARIEAGEAARLRLLAESTGQPGLYLPARPSPAQRLEAQLFATRLQARQREATQLRQRHQQIAAQIEGHDAQLAALARETGLLEEELAAQEALLAKGLAQARPRLAILRELALRSTGCNWPIWKPRCRGWPSRIRACARCACAGPN